MDLTHVVKAAQIRVLSSAKAMGVSCAGNVILRKMAIEAQDP